MKKDLHPEYHEITIEMTDGKTYKTRSTWGKEGDILKLEVDPQSHPAWTGGPQKISERGQLARFKNRYQGLGT